MNIQIVLIDSIQRVDQGLDNMAFDKVYWDTEMKRKKEE